MSEKEKEKEEIFIKEVRTFTYTNEVSFEFSVEVSNTEQAVAEITDFVELMNAAIKDLEVLREEKALLIEKPEQKKEPVEKSSTDNKV